MLATVRADSPERQTLFDAISSRASASAESVRKSVAQYIADIRLRGWDAVREISLKFDGTEPREISAGEIRAAAGRVSPELLEDFRSAAANIADYQKKLLTSGGMWTNADGGRVGQVVRPLARVCVYVPGGTAAYPSSVLMNAVPAKIAGVGEIIMLTPPSEFLRDEVLAAAEIAGVDRVIALGGIQAVASAALGLGPVPRCDKIVGPGNAYVTEAKRRLFGEIDIDLIAGPSEVLVLADETANPAWVAADLISQAEHGELSGAVLVSLDEALVRAVCAELEAQLAYLPRGEIARTALRDYGAAIICENPRQAIDIIDGIAPEHLEICAKDPEGWLAGLHNYGAAFLGDWSPEPLGD